MTITASIHGRIGTDPVLGETKAGKPMCRVNIAVDVTPGNSDTDETLWVSVLAFGQAAETLSKATKGETLTAMGRLSRGRYQGRDGTERESWALLADAVLTTRSARPGGGRKRQDQDQGRQDQGGHRAPRPEFDDELPF